MTNQMTKANNSNADSFERRLRLLPCLIFASNSPGSKLNPQSQCKVESELIRPQFGHFMVRAPFFSCNDIRNQRPFGMRLTGGITTKTREASCFLVLFVVWWLDSNFELCIPHPDTICYDLGRFNTW